MLYWLKSNFGPASPCVCFERLVGNIARSFAIPCSSRIKHQRLCLHEWPWGPTSPCLYKPLPNGKGFLHKKRPPPAATSEPHLWKSGPSIGRLNKKRQKNWHQDLIWYVTYPVNQHVPTIYGWYLGKKIGEYLSPRKKHLYFPWVILVA